jgi:hypothetical protein
MSKLVPKSFQKSPIQSFYRIQYFFNLSGRRRVRLHFQGGDAEVDQQLRIPERREGGGGRQVLGRH